MGIADVSGLPDVPGYQVVRRIARGGMGDVYEAVRVGPGGFQKRVALKQLAGDRAVSGRARARFLEEARLSAQLDHPNVVRVHDVITTATGEMIVMELLRGADLVQVIEAAGVLPSTIALAIAAQVLDGLAYAHAQQLVHRDLAPRNLMLCASGTVKILDFGIAKGVDGPSLTRSGQIHGTVEFLSPEQARGERVDARSDLYQLAATLHWAISGRFPHSGGPAGEVIARIATASPPHLDDVPAPVSALLTRAMANDPAARFVDAAAMAAAVRAALGAAAPAPAVIAALVAALPEPGDVVRAGTISETGEHTIDAPHAAPVEAPRPPPPRRRWPLVIAASATAVAAVAGYMIGTRGSRSPLAPAATAPAEWTQLTFRTGVLGGARFAPDGNAFVYGAAWDDARMEIATSVPGNPQGRALGIDDADLLAVSSQGEMLLQLRPHGYAFRRTGTLARAQLAGGSPREELPDVQAADFAPDGVRVAVLRATAARSWLEFPIGTTLVESTVGWYDDVRVAPSGDRLAVIEHPAFGDDFGFVAVVDANGHTTRLGPGWATVRGLAWSPDGDEIWFTASARGVARQLYAVTLAGVVRMLAAIPSGVRLTDVRADGAILVSEEQIREIGYADLHGDGRVAMLPTFGDVSRAFLSPDGSSQLGTDSAGVLGDGVYGVYLLPTDGRTDPVRIADGIGRGFSPDGRSVLALSQDRARLTIAPVGAGTAHDLDLGELRDVRGTAWLPDGNRIVCSASGPDGIARLWIAHVDGRPPVPFADGYHLGVDQLPQVHPDGSAILLRDASDTHVLLPLDGGPATPLPALPPGQAYLGWSGDGSLIAGAWLWDQPFPAATNEVRLIDPVTGAGQPWRVLEMPSPGVAVPPTLAYLSPDATRYVFSVLSMPGVLYQIEGLR